MNTTLKRVASRNGMHVYAICAPAVAAALTRRANSMDSHVLTMGDITDRMADRFANAFARNAVANIELRRNAESGKWFVAVTPQKPAPKPTVAGPVTDTATSVTGHHECHRCKGTGRIASSRDDGLCYRCKGKGYTTEIDRRRNAGYAKFRKARVAALRVGGAA